MLHSINHWQKKNTHTNWCTCAWVHLHMLVKHLTHSIYLSNWHTIHSQLEKSPPFTKIYLTSTLKLHLWLFWTFCLTARRLHWISIEQRVLNHFSTILFSLDFDRHTYLHTLFIYIYMAKYNRWTQVNFLKMDNC